MTDTIFALSSGAPPAAIAIVRISGPAALSAARAMAGRLPEPRAARVRTVRHPVDGTHLDRGLVLIFPGPDSATGEDLVELHLHGGRAVVAAVGEALGSLPGLRGAEPGEFTRRGLANGRIDLAQAEGLGDLLAAETEGARRAALAMTEGHLSQRIAGWRATLLDLAARIEGVLDFADEADVPDIILADVTSRSLAVAEEMATLLAAPRIERLRDGVRVVLAGPPNSGKSSLLNALAGRDAAIVSAVAGTTRDRIDVSVQRDGTAFVLTDTAGLRSDTDDDIERIGIARADAAMAAADLLLWLGDDPAPRHAIWVHARNDLPGREAMPEGRDIPVSAHDNASVERLWTILVERAGVQLRGADDLVLNERQASCCRRAWEALSDVGHADVLIVADALRRANQALAELFGETGTERMLDTLFARFCVGK